jgi:hypothetical protein|tara:strand:- start:51 stop:206 length:156 start_codon:yes stop_codon:yes gene_type:complete
MAPTKKPLGGGNGGLLKCPLIGQAGDQISFLGKRAKGRFGGRLMAIIAMAA